MSNDPSLRRQAILLGVFVEGGMILLALLLGWFLSEPPLQRLHGSSRDAVLGTAAVGPMLLAVFALGLLRWAPVLRIKQFIDDVLRPLFGACSVAELALISVLAGLGEELLFRGVLQGVLGRWLGPWPGLALASILFGLMHPITLLYVVLAALCGAYLGWLLMASGNLLVPVVTHALYDFVMLVYLLRLRPSGNGSS